MDRFLARRQVEPRQTALKARGGTRLAAWGLWVAPTVLLLAGNLAAQATPEHHAKVTLIAEHDAVRPGGTTWLGLLFEMDPGWHIYWVNPGDSGEPPRVQWELPAGFHAGTLRWPSPIRLGRRSVVDYGYEGQVLLMAPLSAPTQLPSGTTARIAATVKWLVCREICIPDKAQLSISLAAASQSNRGASDSPELFRQARAQWPQALPAGWKVHAQSAGNYIILSADGRAAEGQASFFPLEAGQIDNAAAQVLTSTSSGFRLKLQKSDQLLKPLAELQGVIELGPGRAYRIAAPVAQR